jgi:hypothetical protein
MTKPQLPNGPKPKWADRSEKKTTDFPKRMRPYQEWYNNIESHEMIDF